MGPGAPGAGSALGVLGGLPGLLEAVLLRLLLALVAREEAGPLERGAQLGVELGWARVQAPSGAEDRVAFGVVGGLEWFPDRDLSLAARGALRGVGSAMSLELVLALGAYF